MTRGFLGERPTCPPIIIKCSSFPISVHEHGISRLSACLSLPFYDSKVNSIVIGIKNEQHLFALDSFLQSPLKPNSQDLISWQDSSAPVLILK